MSKLNHVLKSKIGVLSLLLSLAFVAGCSKEEDGMGATLSGIISDSQTGKQLAGAKVELEPLGKEWMTGTFGSYEFDNLPTGNYTLVVSKENYHTERKEINLSDAEKYTLDIALGPPFSDFSVLPLSIDLGYDLNTASVDIVNTGDFPIDWEIKSYGFTSTTRSMTHADSIGALISCSPLSGRVEVGAIQTITLNIDRDFFPVVSDVFEEASIELKVEDQFIGIPIYLKIKPIVSLSEVAVISHNTVLFRSMISSIGTSQVVRHGFCWSEAEYPTIANSDTCNLGYATSGEEVAYTVSSLKPSTTYYVRAYAENAEGISYSTQQQFDVPVTIESFTANGVTFNMVRVEAGTFTMGATSEQTGANDREKPAHSVTLTKDYYIGETEVTQALYKAVMGDNPSNSSGTQKPVEMVSWNDCQTFITELNKLTGLTFRLPTEAEWEYAARGGNRSKRYLYSGSNTIDEVVWYESRGHDNTNDVKSKAPNELDIYDMSGNVWEWCQDWYGSYSSGSQTDPTGPTSGSYRVLRGGGWSSSTANFRVASRNFNSPSFTYNNLGFRLALSDSSR